MKKVEQLLELHHLYFTIMFFLLNIVHLLLVFLALSRVIFI